MLNDVSEACSLVLKVFEPAQERKLAMRLSTCDA